MPAVCLALLLLLPAAAACALYVVPTVAGRRPPRVAPPGPPRHRFAVLVPAHDEERSLPATLRSIAAADYPPGLVTALVVADNCVDSTAAVARYCGAVCVERSDTARRGKGFALAFGLSTPLVPPPDVVLVLDADCELHPAALRELDAVFVRGADAVQAAVRSRNADGGAGGYVAAVGAAVDDAVAAGVDRLGRSVPLRGTGMAFRRALLDRVPWDAFGVAEDAEYAGRLRRAGVRVRFAGNAIVWCEAPGDVSTLVRQRRRWRAAVGTGGRRGLLTRAAASKPLVLAELAAASAASVGAWLLSPSRWSLGCVGVAAGLVVLTAMVYLRAVVAVGLTPRRVRLLARSAGVVARLGWVTAGGLVRRRPAAWDRTPRGGG